MYCYKQIHIFILFVCEVHLPDRISNSGHKQGFDCDGKLLLIWNELSACLHIFAPFNLPAGIVADNSALHKTLFFSRDLAQWERL